MGWKPDLDKETGALPDRIIAALRRDVAGGVLAPGTRLPPQRDLAYTIGVSLGVVSKAYAEAARRGLISGEVGRGTYVLAPPTASTHFTLALGPAEGRIDLARNEPPLAPSQARLGAALKAIGERSDLSGFADYPPPTGRQEHRILASQWLASINGHELAPDQLALTLGAQHAIHIALQVLLAPGETLLTEAGTFHGVRLAASQAGIRLCGLEMDGEGVTPEALDRAAASGAGRVAYLIPTLQNPTGRSLSPSRRAEIAEIARKRDLVLIEDDIYAAYAGARLGEAPRPLAAYCPERVFYI
ncbi:MAG: PLP-dependent aminotransferase family protein, partial [Caulobacteraceae bacterium]|nr:PLP-dependent aminotransferase family protein [Caulobacteraceae bacterium]